jgi:tetratricopeptide (TPR) repeat protein
MGRKRAWEGKYIYLLLAVAICLLLTESCAFLEKRNRELQAETDLNLAEQRLACEDFAGALKIYRRVLARTPQSADLALFHMGVIYAAPRNQERDYQKSLESFQRLMKGFPQSRYRAEAERSITLLQEIMSRDRKMRVLKKQIDTLGTQIEKMKEIDLDIEEKRRKILENHG